MFLRLSGIILVFIYAPIVPIKCWISEAQAPHTDRTLHIPTYFVSSSSANPGPQCDLANGWRQFGSNCYKLKADTRKSWTAARYDCVQDGGDLVSVISAEEEQYVTGTLDSSQFDLWIGLSTLVRGRPTVPLWFNIACECWICQCEDELCFSRNATSFHVKLKWGTISLLGLMLSKCSTQTGAVMNQQCKRSYHIMSFEPKY